MINSCLLAYPSPFDINKRKICLLHIQNYISTITIHYKKSKKISDNLFKIKINSNCLELTELKNFNGGQISLKNCTENLSQKWIF